MGDHGVRLRARCGEAYCSGSSLMPQKMNPDIAELLRAKTGPRDRRRGRAADGRARACRSPTTRICRRRRSRSTTRSRPRASRWPCCPG